MPTVFDFGGGLRHEVEVWHPVGTWNWELGTRSWELRTDFELLALNSQLRPVRRQRVTPDPPAC